MKTTKLIVAVVLCCLVSGCGGPNVIGSGIWHQNRLREISAAYGDGDITEAEYISLRNEADLVRNQ